MSKSLLSTVLKLAFAGSVTVMQVSSYTFDPLNNSWKPSGVQHRRHHTSSSSASSYSNSYAPAAEPNPSSSVVGSVEFSYNEDDIVRHHYAGWGSDRQVEIDTHDPAFLGKESVVQIEYNKKTGEVSLHDQDGIVTKEEYERLMKEIKSSSSDEGGAATDDEADVGTTHFLDTEELDLTDIIDAQVIDATQGEELDLTADTIDTKVIDTQVIDTEVELLPMKELATTVSQEEQGQQHQYQYQPQPQHQEYSQPQTEPEYAQYHHSESVSSEEYPQTQPQYAEYHHSESVSTESFNTFSIPQPPIEINHPVPQHPAYPVAEEQAYAQAQHYYQPEPPQPVYAQAQAVAVAEPVMASGQHYYQTQPAAQAVMEPPPAVQYQQQYHQYQEQSVASYSTTSVASSATTDVVEQDAEDYGIPESGYRSSRGFGFAHRRETFVYYEENNF